MRRSSEFTVNRLFTSAKFHTRSRKLGGQDSMIAEFSQLHYCSLVKTERSERIIQLGHIFRNSRDGE